MSILLSARQAEEANRDLARTARASSNSGLMLIPVVAVTQQSGSSRTPRVHLSKSGEFIARPAHVPGAGSSSGAPRERSGASSGQRRPRDESAAPRGPAIPGMGPSVTQQRSKRPKLSQPARHSFSSAADQQDNAKALYPCRRVLKELMNHQMAWPFLKPVDPMQVPGYYDVIKDAIDLGTIKKRLEGNQYDDIEEFEHEVHRVWDNCFKFNQEGTDVHTMAKTLKGIFEQKMETVPRDGGEKGENEQMKKMRKEMMALQKQMQKQQELIVQQQQLQLQQLQQGGGFAAAAAPPSQPARRQSTGGGRRNSAAGGVKENALMALQQVAGGGDQVVDLDRDMTFEEKASLSAGINRLTSNNLAKVVQIIKENMPSLGAGSEEIEVDINALDNRTLWKLHNFVESCKATKKKPKKRPAETADSRRRASAESLASTTQELMQVEAGLHAIEEPRGPQGIAFQQQDDNDSPADSASDSGSDDGGSALPIGAAGSSNGGLGGNQAWSDFANAKKQREREQQEQEARQRRQQQQALLESQRARQQAHEQRDAQQRERDAQRAAERAQRETEEPAFDLLGQSNMMASFQGGGAGGDGDLDFGLDEYGGGV
jgi:hypothetical protein